MPAAVGDTGLTPSKLAVLCAAANRTLDRRDQSPSSARAQTVKTQRRSILLKLGARNAPQAVYLASERGILVVGQAQAGHARIAIARASGGRTMHGSSSVDEARRTGPLVGAVS